MKIRNETTHIMWAIYNEIIDGFPSDYQRIIQRLDIPTPLVIDCRPKKWCDLPTDSTVQFTDGISTDCYDSPMEICPK